MGSYCVKLFSTLCRLLRALWSSWNSLDTSVIDLDDDRHSAKTG